MSGADPRLRPAIDLAVAVARAGQRETPPRPPPRGLLRVLRFSRLPPAALDTVKRFLDDDPEFREHVASGAEEQALGRPAWLLIARPPGWEVELEALLAEPLPPGADLARAELASVQVSEAERALTRRLRVAEQARDRAVVAHERLERQASAARDKAGAVGSELAAARARIAELERAVDSAQRSEAGAKSSEAAAKEAASAAGLAASVARQGEAEALAAARRAQAQHDESEIALLRTRSSQRNMDRDALERLVADGHRSIGDLRRALDEIGAIAEASGGWTDAERFEQALTAQDSEARSGLRRDQGPSAASATGARTGRKRRPAPERLPSGMRGDGPEAAEHLVRVAGVVVLVDGYNAAMALWAGLPIGELRYRLLDALAELALRTGADVRAVFDGADDVAVRGGTARQAVRVVFSPGGVEADEVILDMVEQLRPARPVVVASDDRRVQEGARERGANVISSLQLSSALGRELR